MVKKTNLYIFHTSERKIMDEPNPPIPDLGTTKIRSSYSQFLNKLFLKKRMNWKSFIYEEEPLIQFLDENDTLFKKGYTISIFGNKSLPHYLMRVRYDLQTSENSVFKSLGFSHIYEYPTIFTSELLENLKSIE